jgi:catechol 2,3-dioxygenase-like lactoylglutathione lyase family enzyme
MKHVYEYRMFAVTEFEMAVEDKPTFTLDHMRINAEDPDALAAYYADVFSMELKKMPEGAWCCEGKDRRFEIAKGEANAFGYAAFVCATEGDLTAIRSSIKAKGYECLSNPSPFFKSAAAFAVKDPDGNMLVYSTRKDARSSDGGGLVARLQHYAVATPNLQEMIAFYKDVVGFRISDIVQNDEGVETTAFLRGDHEHHMLAIFGASSSRLDHICHEVGEWNLIRDWADFLSKREIQVAWGPGRHGPGNNLFMMFHDPAGHWMELSAELEVMEGRELKYWPHSERTLNLWGKGYIRT